MLQFQSEKFALFNPEKVNALFLFAFIIIPRVLNSSILPPPVEKLMCPYITLQFQKKLQTWNTYFIFIFIGFSNISLFLF